MQGTAQESSDLDLAIMTDKPLPSLRTADLRDDFTESDLPFRVDVVDWAATGERFRKIIARQAIPLRCGGRQSARENQTTGNEPV